MNQKELFWISITIFLTIVAWMALDLYRAKTKISVNTGFSSIQRVDFKLNTDIINSLKDKNP